MKKLLLIPILFCFLTGCKDPDPHPYKVTFKTEGQPPVTVLGRSLSIHDKGDGYRIFDMTTFHDDPSKVRLFLKPGTWVKIEPVLGQELVGEDEDFADPPRSTGE